MPLIYACVAPHGGEIVPALAGRRLSLFKPTRKGMLGLAKEMKKARPDTIIIASPHNLRLDRHIGVVTSEFSSGRVKERGREIRLRARCDVELAKRLATAAGSRGLPVVAANYGVFKGPLSDMPMDWGTLIPLWFLLKGARLKSRIVVVTPSREIPLAQNIEFGRVAAEVSAEGRARVAFVASADQAHAHRKGGPYGFDRRAAEYDRRVVESIGTGRLGEAVTAMEPEFVEGAKPDSLWQMAMLVGVLSVIPMEGELLSYQVPTYYGMLCASFRPKSGS